MSRERLIYIIVFCLYIMAVAFLCFAKPDDMPQLPTLWFDLPADKVGHFLMFVPFPILAYSVFHKDNVSLVKHLLMVLILMIVGMGMAIATEQIQAQLAYRAAELDDFHADLAGLAAGSASTVAFIIFRRNR